MDITKRKITKIAREVSKFTVRTLRAEGVGPGEFDVLHAIRKNPGITQAGVCRITGFDKGAVARQTASLEAKDYLRREANPADGRSRCLAVGDDQRQILFIRVVGLDARVDATGPKPLGGRDAALNGLDHSHPSFTVRCPPGHPA